MLYKEKELTKELFENPPAQYRGTPFWAWNCKMTKENIDYSLDALEAMGMGGGHIHCRTGMANVYLGEEFMELVKYANEEAKKRKMLTWLYDEDRWPSGAGGGYVTKNEAYRIRFLVFSPVTLENKTVDASGLSSSGQAVRSNNRRLLARYGVTIRKGCLEKYRMLEEGQKPDEGEKEWFAYLEISGDNPWFNNEAYLNTLDKKAVEEFVRVTHEKYAECLGEEFGKSIPAIFTDEPQFSHKTRLGFALDEKEINIPFTDDLEETFQKEYGHSLLESLPELFWELPEGAVSVTRYQYHDHIAERFASAFADTVGKWCDEHGILLTGHMMEEPTLKSQTAALGEAMRSYRSFTLPGVDMLCDWRELSTVKQAQSAAHQYDREGVISELYGVTNWDFDFRGHKLQGDWQAALGVTVRVPHLTWTSMAGEAKRDYPAAIGYQSPWYQEYSYIENYFARINTVLSRGRAKVRIGVIHPIETYWLFWGTEEQTGGIREEMDRNFRNLIDWLLYGFQDFDFIAESMLPGLTDSSSAGEGKSLRIGAMEYDVIVVPNCLTLRGSTYDVLDSFTARGGTVILAGETPKYENAVPTDRGEALRRSCIQTAFNKNSLLEALEPYREVEVRDASGNRAANMIHQLRAEGGRQWLFLAHVEKMKNPDIPKMEELTITLKGKWSLKRYQPLDGSISSQGCKYQEGNTVLKVDMFEHDSLLLEMTKCEANVDNLAKETKDCEYKTEILIPDEVPVSLTEPNVLLLDMAQYKLDDGEWQNREEILRIDNIFREQLGYPLRMEAFAQPWLNQEEEPYSHRMTLRFDIQSEVEVAEVELAAEDAADYRVWWNGQEIKEAVSGWYVDRCIQRIPVGSIGKGKNELLVEIPYNSKRNVESMYLLGAFGVQVSGSRSVITGEVKKLSFGDITGQGLPFYGGNVIYHIELETKAQNLKVQTSMFRNPVLAVHMDGKKCGYIAFSPYTLDLGSVSAGRHKMDITAFGNRINTFGTLHNCDRATQWYGPNAWRTEEEAWAYEYQLKETGILKRPVVSGITVKDL